MRFNKDPEIFNKHYLKFQAFSWTSRSQDLMLMDGSHSFVIVQKLNLISAHDEIKHVMRYNRKTLFTDQVRDKIYRRHFKSKRMLKRLNIQSSVLMQHFDDKPNEKSLIVILFRQRNNHKICRWRRFISSLMQMPQNMRNGARSMETICNLLRKYDLNCYYGAYSNAK